MADGDIRLWPLFPEARGDMLIHPFYPLTPTPHYISLDQMRAFVGQGTQGPAGPPGAQGPAGADGPAGPQGPAGTSASITVSDTAPTASPGDLWFDSASCNLFVRYADSDSSAWVVAVNQPGPTGAQGAQGPAGATGATGPNWTVGSGLTLSSNTISLTTPALPLTGGTLSGYLAVNERILLGQDVNAQLMIGRYNGTLGGSLINFIDSTGGSNHPTFASFQVASVEKARLTDSGNLTLAGTRINFNGSTGIASSGAGSLIDIDASDCIVKLGSDTGSLHVRNASGADKFVFTFTGGIAYKPGGGTWTDISDARLKHEVQEYKSGLAEIVKLRPVRYRHNGRGNTTDDGNVYTGLIAQEAQEVMPELVGRMSARLDKTDGHETELLTVDATPLIFALIGAVRELSEKVAALEARDGS